MNTQKTQDLRIGMQAEALNLCESSFDRLVCKTVTLVNSLRGYFAKKALTSLFLNVSPRQLRDIGLDDPALQMRLLDSNLNTEASIREMNRNTLLIR
ncbi:MAG: hypothetical protein ACI822_001316 [Gammaproteobacteria bacterium]|jgi:hypothetical protein